MKKHKFFAVFTAALLAFTVFGCKQNDDSNPEKCTLTYDSNGGSGEMKSTTGDEGTEITLAANAFTKTGYTFSEWNTKADGKGEKYADKAKIKLTANTTLYAQWTANTYTVNFDSNGGSDDALADISATYDKEFALPENTFTKIGYNFASWNTKADGSGNSFTDKTNVKNLTAENNATVTLYAQWVDRGTHKITYNLNGGNHIGTQKEQFKKTEDVTLGTAEKTGYTFGGWYEAEDSTGTAVTGWKAGEKTEDVALYANWTTNNYTVKFDANGGGGSTLADIHATYDKDFALPENTFTRIGYNFVGWNTEKDGSGTDYEAKANVKNLTTENGATVTLYAKWTAIVYSITYELDGGTNVPDNPTSYTIEDSITLKDPTKAGYTFLGWYDDPLWNEHSKISKITEGTSFNQTLYAKWEANTYTVTFDKNADDATGDALTDIQATYDKEFALTGNTFEKIGYNFADWNTEKDGSGISFADKSIVKNLTAKKNVTVTLYAKWEATKYTITYENTENATNDNPASYTIETETITLKEPTKDGYTFEGWYTDKSFTEESKVTEIKKGSIGERTLYAKWTANNYTVRFDANGGTGSMAPQTFTYGTSQALSENTFTRTDYEFAGWATSANGNVTYKDSQDYSISAENVTLYAIWRDIISFKKIQTVSITGSETWTPESNVFVSGRVLDIKAFYMSDHEVTQAEWKDVMGSAPSDMAPADGNADNNPVNYVSWYDAIVYCNKRSIKEGLTPCYTINGFTNPDDWGDVPTFTSDTTWNNATCNFTANGYRLPTEAEWEWAARGGENYKYAGSDTVDEVAWYSSNSSSKTHEVKTKKSNGYGLYDMSGNVKEWCWDWYSNSISTDTPAIGASYLKPRRCIRGGSCLGSGIRLVDIAYRLTDHLAYRIDDTGFRVVQTAEE